MKERDYIESGTILPGASKASAISLYTVMLNRFPSVSHIAPEKWDFVLTIAGIFVAISQLNYENVSHIQKEEVLDEVTRASIGLYPDAVEACEDCRQFVDCTHDGLKEAKVEAQYLFSDSLGAWVVWNLFGEAPASQEQRELAKALGAMIVHSFVSWWK